MSRTPIHPGTILGEELKQIGVSQDNLGRDLGVSGSTINRVVTGKQAVTAAMALRLGHWFGTTPQFWVNLQSQYDLRVAEGKIGETVKALPTRPDAEPNVPAAE